ncbi:right-handed parallel beta-helix repeat-containing protein [bacterium]|nr:right-handed parallel beta-helix repeat-containing protein [bacterium]
MLKNLFSSNNFKKAFTLIEILVVVFIIVILGYYIAYVQVEQRGSALARDTKRASELNALRDALQLYYMDHGRFPTSTDLAGECNIAPSTDPNHCPYLEQELVPTYIRGLPLDPKYPQYVYKYTAVSSGQNYTLKSDLETRKPLIISSGGFAISPPSPPGNVCGNGIREFPEVCDDGNTQDCNPYPGCSADCSRYQECGNGVVECGEECDDGNTTSGDGCDSTCHFEHTTVNCFDCGSCNNAINAAHPGDTIILTADIVNHNGTCIKFSGENNITFDCQGHKIDGIDSSSGFWSGIYVSHSNNIKIKNCNITDFEDGISVEFSSYVKLENVSSESNTGSGISIFGTDNVSVINSILAENRYLDVYFDPLNISDCSNTFSNVRGSGGRDIGYFHDTAVHLSNRTFSELILCNADGSTLNNITIRGSNFIKNNTLQLNFTDNSVLNHIISNNNYKGLRIIDSDSNSLTSLTLSNNDYSGLDMLYSASNVVNNSSIVENRHFDVLFSPGNISDCNNTFLNISSTGGRSIKYYHDISHLSLSNQTFSELILCNVDDSTFNNITIRGSNIYINNGLFLYYVDNGNFTNIDSSGNYYGFFGSSSDYNKIIGLVADRNEIGVGLVNSDFNDIENAHFAQNWRGVVIHGSDNLVRHSQIINSSHISDGCGIYVGGRRNYYFDNIISNIVNTIVIGSDNWNTSTSPGPNIIGGPLLGGNYWSNPSHNGYSDICIDVDHNGFCDQPYDVEHGDSDCSDTSNCDHYPLAP